MVDIEVLWLILGTMVDVGLLWLILGTYVPAIRWLEEPKSSGALFKSWHASSGNHDADTTAIINASSCWPVY